MNLQHVEYFTVLAETEHMTRTAELLNTTQPNISYAINQLEIELGIPLIRKQGRNIKLTKYGKQFLTYAQNGIAALEKGKKVIQEEINPEAGTIRFGFVYSMGEKIAPSLIKKFLTQESNLNINFEFIEGNTHDIITALEKEEIDVGLSSKPAKENIDTIPFIDQDLIVVVNNKHPSAEKGKIYISELEDEPFVGYVENSGLRPYLSQIFKDIAFEPNYSVEIKEDHTMLGFIASGFGVGILPESSAIDNYPVKKLKIKDKLEDRYIYLSKRKNDYLSPLVQKFYDYCVSEAKKNTTV